MSEVRENKIRILYDDLLKESDLSELVTEDHISLIVREQMRINSLLEIKIRLETDLA